jgi:hypothetical protein
MRLIFVVFMPLVVLLSYQGGTPSTIVQTIASGQASAAVEGRGGVADVPLRKVSIKGSNLPLALSYIADTYKIPIGVEVSPDDDLLKDRNIVVRLQSGTLKEVLNSLVSQVPLYTWEVDDNVVNVFPKGNREPVIKTLLETRIDAFKITPGMSRFTFRESLTGRPELKNVLAGFGVEPDNELLGIIYLTKVTFSCIFLT